MRHSGYLFLYSSLFLQTVNIAKVFKIYCRWVDSNPGPLWFWKQRSVNCDTTTGQVYTWILYIGNLFKNSTAAFQIWRTGDCMRHVNERGGECRPLAKPFFLKCTQSTSKRALQKFVLWCDRVQALIPSTYCDKIRL